MKKIAYYLSILLICLLSFTQVVQVKAEPQGNNNVTNKINDFSVNLTGETVNINLDVSLQSTVNSLAITYQKDGENAEFYFNQEQIDIVDNNISLIKNIAGNSMFKANGLWKISKIQLSCGDNPGESVFLSRDVNAEYNWENSDLSISHVQLLKLNKVVYSEDNDDMIFSFDISKSNALEVENISLGYQLNDLTSYIYFSNNSNNKLVYNSQTGLYEGKVKASDIQNSTNFTKGTWNLFHISIWANDQHNRYYHIDNGDMVGEETDKSWSDYALTFETDYNDEHIPLPEPKIERLYLLGDAENVNVPIKMAIDLEVDIPEGFAPSVSLYFKNKRTNEVTSNDLYISQIEDEYFLTAGDHIKYLSHQYEFMYVMIHAYNLEPDYEQTPVAIYSHLSKEELLQQISYIPPYNVYSLDNISNFDNLIININNYIEDTTPPELLSYQWEKEEILLPGVAKLKFNVEEESAINTTYAFARDSLGNIVEAAPFVGYDYERQFEFTLPRYNSGETLELMGFYLEDIAGNGIIYYVGDNLAVVENSLPLNLPIKNKVLINDLPVLSLKQVYEFDEILTLTDTNLITKLKNSPENKIYVINTFASQVITKEIFDVIKGRDITLIFEDVTNASSFHNSAIQWVINGRDINNQTKDIDITTTIGTVNDKVVSNGDGFGFDLGYYPDSNQEERNINFLYQVKNLPILKYYYDYLQQFDSKTSDYAEEFYKEYQNNERLIVEFAPNGELPGKFTIRIKIDYALKDRMPNMDINVYYQSGDTYELIEQGIYLSEDYSYSFDIVHNSTYVLTKKALTDENNFEEEIGKPNDNDIVNTGANKNYTGYSVLLISGILLTYIIYNSKKTKRSH